MTLKYVEWDVKPYTTNQPTMRYVRCTLFSAAAELYFIGLAIAVVVHCAMMSQRSVLECDCDI